MMYKVDDPKNSYYGRRVKRLDVFIAIAENHKLTGKGLLASQTGATEEELQELVDKGMVYYNSIEGGEDFELLLTVPIERELEESPLLFGLPEEVREPARTETRSNPDDRLPEGWIHADSAETIEKIHEYVKRTPAYIRLMKSLGAEEVE